MLGALVHSGDVIKWLLWLVIPVVFLLMGRRKLGIAGIVVVILMILISLPSGAGARENAQRASCLSNQQTIEQAVNQLAKTKGAKAGDAIDAQEMAALLKGIGMPSCPAGGTYLITKFGEHPACSLGTHAPEAK